MGRSWEAVLEASTINPQLLVERVKPIRKVRILCFREKLLLGTVGSV